MREGVILNMYTLSLEAWGSMKLIGNYKHYLSISSKIQTLVFAFCKQSKTGGGEFEGLGRRLYLATGY